MEGLKESVIAAGVRQAQRLKSLEKTNTKKTAEVKKKADTNVKKLSTEFKAVDKESPRGKVLGEVVTSCSSAIMYVSVTFIAV